MRFQKKILDKIIQLAEHDADIEVVWLYGSRAKGSALEHSDFDIALAFKNFKLSSLDKFLRPNELALDWANVLGISSSMLSLVDINLVPIYLAFNIVNDGNVIYQTKTARSFVEQSRIFSLYEHSLHGCIK